MVVVSCDFRFLRMRDFNLSKAKEMFLNFLKWREDFGVDAIPKVNS
jgi:phosphopantetheinyl transferase